MAKDPWCHRCHDTEVVGTCPCGCGQPVCDVCRGVYEKVAHRIGWWSDASDPKMEWEKARSRRAITGICQQAVPDSW